MRDNSISKWMPEIDLAVHTHMALATFLVRMMDLHFRGRVNLQKDILGLVHATDRVTNGAAHAMIEHLAEKGYLRIERWGPARRYKRLIVVRRPGDGALRIRRGSDGRVQGLPDWARTLFPGPPNHRHHLRRHLALLDRWRGAP